MGGGYAIRNIQIGTEEAPTNLQFAGLFGSVASGNIQDLGVEWTGIYASYDSADIPAKVGGIVAFNYQGTIINCYTSGQIISSSPNNQSLAGGVVGHSEDGTLTGCHSSSKVSVTSDAYSYAGGISGYISGGNVSQCYSTGEMYASSVSSFSISGGISGYAEDANIANCYATGLVSAASSTSYSDSEAGGIIGEIYAADISNCFSTATVSSSAGVAYAISGGITAYNYEANIYNCYAGGMIDATSGFYTYAGGIAGFNWAGYISDSHALCSTIQAIASSADAAFARRIGSSFYGTISNSFASTSMELKVGSSTEDLSVIEPATADDGQDLTADPLELLNNWVNNNPTSNNGIKHLGWKVVEGENNGLPIFESDDTPANIPTMNADKAKVYGTSGMIVVENANAPVLVFNTNGILVKSITKASVSEQIDIQRGYYIVHIGKSSYKVVVD